MIIASMGKKYYCRKLDDKSGNSLLVYLFEAKGCLCRVLCENPYLFALACVHLCLLHLAQFLSNQMEYSLQLAP